MSESYGKLICPLCGSDEVDLGITPEEVTRVHSCSNCSYTWIDGREE
jgi:predicted RNA-binding Zn-ribbon protein involved in translation (DUF1610 family)